MSTSPLETLASRPGLADVAARLTVALATSADPAAAPQRAVDVIEAADGPRLAAISADRPGPLVRVLTTLCGAAPFFVPLLTRHPQWVLDLAEEDFALPRTSAQYADRLRERLRATSPDEHADTLRCFKYYELARITVRELSADLVAEDHAAETLRELSHLADVLLSHALAVAAGRVETICGPPAWKGPNGEDLPLGFVVLALGKLGSEELNYSSDVDLIYVFESPQEFSHDLTVDRLQRGPGGLSPAEYFTRLAQHFGRVVSESTQAGFLYRVDLDLRPEGTKGPLVSSSRMLADYYESWAATWEKAAFMKARPVAGDLKLGWRIIRAIDPMIYRSAMDYESVGAIRELKEKVEQAKGRGAETFNVKIGVGGIRDVEFVAQALQLLHGGRIADVRSRSTEAALVALAQVGILPAAEASDLLAAYRFLRRTENRLQMVAERQTHQLPRAPAQLERIARAMGFVTGTPVVAFGETLQAHRSRTQQIFARLFEESGSERILALFAREAPRFFANRLTRPMIQDLAAQFAREIDASPEPQRAMNNLDRFILGVGSRRFYYELLLDRPELVRRLVTLFATSEYLSTYFANYPRFIEPIFDDPNVLLLPRADLEKNFVAARAALLAEGRGDETETELEALRLFHHREVLNVALLDLVQKVTRAEAEAALTEIAEICLVHGLSVAGMVMERQGAHLPAAARAGEFLIVGMGKLASRELTYGSDLDVVFLYDVEGAADDALLEAQEYFVRLAQKLIWALRTRTSSGICYDIDARLRPSGSQGMLVMSLRAFARYHDTSARVWERQALLRARPVAGPEVLGRTFEAVRRQILRTPLPSDAPQELHRIRLRTEVELARETLRRHDFKSGRGGMQDIETVVQFLQLRHGATHPALFDVDPVENQLERLRQLELLDPADAELLQDGWQFLQSLSSRLRILENRSISDLDEERGDLDALARGLGYPERQRPGAARRALLDDYGRHTDAIRSVYRRVIGL